MKLIYVYDDKTQVSKGRTRLENIYGARWIETGAEIIKDTQYVKKLFICFPTMT